MRHYCLPIIIVLLCSACSAILSKDKMADILVEMHWSDAILYGTRPVDLKDSIKIYNAIFERHQTNFTQFENSLRYYSRSAPMVKDIYKKVNKELTYRVNSAQNDLDNYLEGLEELRMELVEKWIRNDLPFAPAVWQHYSFYSDPAHYEENCCTPDISH